MKSYRWIIFCLIVLSGCAQLPSPTSETARTPATPKMQAPVKEQVMADANSVALLLKFAQAYAAMSPEMQKREYSQVNARRKNEYNRMQLATMAIMARPRDDARVIAMLDECLKAPDSRDEDLRTLAGFLKTTLSGQPKPDDSTVQLMQKLKDEQKRADMLQHKLDELLAVEKAMSDRHEAQPK